MIKEITSKKFYGVILVVFFFLLPPFVSLLCARDYIDKEHRDYFLSEDLIRKFYKIEVQTNRFMDRQHSGINGLVESFRGTSRYAYDLFRRTFCYGRGGSLDGQSFTYDGAVSIIAYLLSGNTKKAERMLNVYRKEFYWVKNDMVGLFNSYRTDVYDGTRLNIGIDGDRMHLGPAMWIALAALQYTAITGDLQYLPFTIDLAKWGQKLNHFKFPDGDKGAVSMGYGWGPDWSIVYSTENNIDYYAVLKMLRYLKTNGNRRVKRIFEGKNYSFHDIDTEMKGIERWLKEVAYDPNAKAFYCGYNEKGIDKTYALDTITWTISALGPGKLSEMGINPFNLIDFAERKFGVFNNVDGEKVKGFDFTSAEGRLRKLRVVWVEGTGQQVVAYQILSDYAWELGFTKRAEEYRQKAIKYSNYMEKASMKIKLIDYSLPYTCKRPAEKEIITTFMYEWEVPRGRKGKWVASISSTVWRYFALAAFNPLNFDTETVSYSLFSKKNN